MPVGAVMKVAATLLALLVLAGCGPVSPGTAARARQATSGPTGTMTFQLPHRPTSFDPFAAPGSADALLAAAHFEPLVSAVEGRLMPRMADWWSTTDEGRRLVLTIKRDRWSDNERMSAADLLFTLEQHLRPGSRSPLVPTLLQISGARDFHEGRSEHLAGVVAETSRGVVITLDGPDPNYLAKLTDLVVLPQHVYAGQDLGRPETFREPKVGSGAYLFDAWQGADQVTLLPNPQVQPFTRLDRVVGRVVAPHEVIPALQERTLDAVLNIPPRDVGRLPAGYQPLSAPGDSVVGLSGARGPLADPRVRRALAYALDREGMLDRHLAGRGRVVDSVLFAPDWAASPDRARYPHDTARARALLAEAGWRPSTRLALVALTDDTDRAVWDALTDELAGVGVTATVTIRPTTERAAVRADPNVHGVIDTYTLAVPDPALAEPWVRCGAIPGYCNPELDAALERGRGQQDLVERQASYRAADRILADELPVIPLWVPDATVVVTAGRGGLNPLLRPATAMIDFWGPA